MCDCSLLKEVELIVTTVPAWLGQLKTPFSGCAWLGRGLSY